MMMMMMMMMMMIFFLLLAIIEVGGYEAMETKFMNAVSNETRFNRSHYSCGVPPSDSLHIFRDAVTGDIPWPGALLGLSTLGLYTWDQDQVYSTLVLDNYFSYIKTLVVVLYK